MKSNILALMLGLLLAFLCSEVVLRVFPPALMSDELYRQYDHDVGWLLKPVQSARTSKSCLNIHPIHVNHQGFRDKEWEGKSTIAVLGDSFMQGSQLPDGTLVPQVLESLLRVPVMNTGIDGFGTLHEYLVYKKYVAPHKPEIVLLFFYPVNDVVDNSFRFLKDGTPMPRGFIDKDGKISVRLPDVSPEERSGLSAFVKRHVKTALLFRRGYDAVSALQNQGPNASMGVVYMPETDELREAWQITEHYLMQLQQEVSQQGGRFFVVVVPEYIQIANDWQQDLKDHFKIEVPKGFSRERPVRRLEQIAQRNGISLIELDQFFRGYRDRWQLPAPYFYYRCDGHWNPMGHFLAANFIAKYLVENQALSGDVDVFARNLQMSPSDILSAEGYRQIYTVGRFDGSTNIMKLANQTLVH